MSIGGINNTSANSSYSDYSSLFTNVIAGNSYGITVTIGSGYSTDQIFVWCDWNRDGDFLDAGESVYTSALGVGPHSGNIVPPTGTSTGIVRMRIRLTDTSSGPNSTSCGVSTYGEVEDYSLNVITGFAMQEEPSIINNNTRSLEEVGNTETNLLSIYPNPNTGTFTIRATTAGNYSIINESGQLIEAFKLNDSNNYRIDITGLAAGFYIVQGESQNGKLRQKIVVTH